MKKTLFEVNPRVSAEWHPTKNGKLTPKDVSANSYKKVWWLCHSGHEWKDRIVDRNKGLGCPFDSGRRFLFKKDSYLKLYIKHLLRKVLKVKKHPSLPKPH